MNAKILCSALILLMCFRKAKCLECYQCGNSQANPSCSDFLDDSSPEFKSKPCSRARNATFCIKKVFEAHLIICYQCTAPENMDCGDAMIHMDDGGTAKLSPCDHIYDAKYCIKSTGNYGGGLGTKRFCSALDLGNYCNFVKQPGVVREYRSCIYTCNSDGCNLSYCLKPMNLALFFSLFYLPFVLF